MSELKTYVGTKIVNAAALNKGEYNDVRGWKTPKEEDPKQLGYLVEYLGSPPNHPDFANYISWCPKEEFEKHNIDLGNVERYEPHQVRMVAEYLQLAQKTEGLAKYIANEALFDKVSPEEKTLMTMQLRQMNAYQSTLQARIQLIVAADPSDVVLPETNEDEQA